MKKKSSLILCLIIIIAVLGIVIAVLNNKKNPEVNSDNQQVSTVKGVEGTENTEVSSVDIDTTAVDCEKTIENYLAGADKEGKGEGVKVGDNVVVDYIGRLEDGTVFDTSIESIAKACGKYTDGGDYTEGFEFTVGVNQVVKGFDNGVLGMKVGQTKTVKFGPEEGYGLYDKSKVETYSANEVGDLSQYELGLYLCKDWYACGVITKLTDKELVVDFNSELAGKTLIFDITIKSIN